MNFELEKLTTQSIFVMLVIFTRIGSMFMTLPGFGESYINIYARLLMSLLVSFSFYFGLYNLIPKYQDSVLWLLIILLTEFLIGVLIGTIARIFISSANTAGMLISTQTGLGSAILFDPTQGTQSAIVGNFYSLLMIIFMMSLNLHHIMIKGIFDSYNFFKVGEFIIIDDFTQSIILVMRESFIISFKIAAPQLIIGLLFMFGSGILARLMPNMQVFFVVTPIQILIGFLIIYLTTIPIIIWSIELISEKLQNLTMGL